MKKYLSVFLICLAFGMASAEELRISTKEPLVVSSTAAWKASLIDAAMDYPYETHQLDPPAARNAVCLISVLGKDRAEFSDAELLKKLLRADSRPYVGSPEELPKIELKQLKISAGLGYYANFVDPDLVGKPVQLGNYKAATLVFLSLGSKYLIKATVLSDEIGGADYLEAMKIVESITVKN